MSSRWSCSPRWEPILWNSPLDIGYTEDQLSNSPLFPSTGENSSHWHSIARDWDHAKTHSTRVPWTTGIYRTRGWPTWSTWGPTWWRGATSSGRAPPTARRSSGSGRRSRHSERRRGTSSGTADIANFSPYYRPPRLQWQCWDSKKCHCKREASYCIQTFLLYEGPIGVSEKCHCKRRASYCVTITGVTASLNFEIWVFGLVDFVLVNWLIV